MALKNQGTRNQGERWTPEQLRTMRKLAKGDTPTGLIAMDLGRTEAAIRSKAAREKISLEPPNRSPYGPRRRR